ncbi:TonB-dependent receptor [Phragmitibacter flavus]|nr:TonB-dependent siderophore receptor [Phragmitibacter flavus]
MKSTIIKHRKRALPNSLTAREGIALTTSVLCAAGALPAQTAPAPAPDNGASPTVTPEVVVTGQADPLYKPQAVASPKLQGPLRDVPQTITVIPQTVIQEQGATNLRDVLRNVPGISIQAGEGGGGLPGDNLSIRGFNARTDFFIDGVRDFGAYSRDPFNYEQIEVAKGPSSSTSGRGSTGGSINLVTKTPKLEPFYHLDTMGGTDKLFRSTIDINQPFLVNPGSPGVEGFSGGKGAKEVLPVAPVAESGHAFRLNGLFHTNEVAGRDVVEQERWAIAPSLAFGLGTETRLTFTYLHMEEDNVPEYGIPWVPPNSNPQLSRFSDQAPPVSFDNFYGIRGYDYEETETDVAGILFEHDFSDGLRLRNFSRYARTDRSSAITAPRFADVNNSLAINRQLQRRELTNEVWANQTDLSIDFDTGSIRHALVVGVEFVWEKQITQNGAQNTNQPTTNLFNPTPSDRPFGPMPGITNPPNKTEAQTISAYVFDKISFGEKWELTGGVRYDRVDADYSAPGVSFSRVDDLVSWRAALAFKPVENGNIYFGYATSFNPSIDGNANAGLGLTANTVNLDPEESRTFELGTKWDLFEDRLSLTGAIFRTEKTNARTSDPTDPVAVTVLDGEQVVQGFEIGFAGSITDWWRVFGGYTYLDSEVEDSANVLEIGNQLSNTPEHSFSFWTVFDLPYGFELGGGANFVDSRFNNNLNARQAPSYWLFDAMLGYKVNDNLSFRFNVYNIGDERYIDRLGGGHFVPGVGRTFALSASVKF